MGQSNPARRSVPSDSPQASAGRVPDQERRLADLVDRIARGDQWALGALYDETAAMMYSLALRMLGDSADAEEVTLDAYTKAWRAAATYDSTRGTVLAWLATLTRSRSIDRLRSRTSRAKFQEPASAAGEPVASTPDPEQIAQGGQHRELIMNALTVLSPEQREVIELAYFEGLTHSELSERLGQPVGTVKTRIRLGMIKLRDALPFQPGTGAKQ